MTVYFFAASHVILRTVKAIPEYGKRKGKHSTEGGDGEKVKLSSQSTSDENENKVLTIIFGIRERKQPHLRSFFLNNIGARISEREKFHFFESKGKFLPS